MKITRITPYPAWIGIRNQLLVKVETDEGVLGDQAIAIVPVEVLCL